MCPQSQKDSSTPVGAAARHTITYPKRTGDPKKDFMAVFDQLASELLDDVSISKPAIPEKSLPYLKRMVEYNVPKGKLNRGMTVCCCGGSLSRWARASFMCGLGGQFIGGSCRCCVLL